MKLSRSFSLICVCLSTTFALSAHADDDNCQDQNVNPIPIVETTASGNASLCDTANRLKGKAMVTGLVAGNAYTVWWVYFDDPTQCIHGGAGVCGPADFAGDDPLAVLGRMDSAIAPRNGRLTFSDRWRGMQPSEGSLIQLLIFGHGAADLSDGRHLARQLLTPEDPSIGTPHLGNIADGPLGYPVAITTFIMD